MSKTPVSNSENMLLLRIHQALETFGQNSPQVPERFLEGGKTYVKERPPSKSDLKIRLHQILDSPDHIVSGVITDNHVYIGELDVVKHNFFTIILK